MNIYRNRSSIKSVTITDGLLFICSENMIRIFLLSNKKFSCSIKVDHTPLKVFGMDTFLIYYTKNEIHKLEFKDSYRSFLKENNDPNNLLIDYKLMLLSQKKSLDYISLIKNHIFVFSDLHADVINVSTGLKHRKDFENNKGICVKCVRYLDNLYLGFEDGSISYVKDFNINRVIDSKIFETVDVLKASMNIISFDIQNDLIAISFIGKQIGVYNIKEDNFRYIETTFTPKSIQFWKDSLVSLDSENNMFLLDFSLKIFYHKNYEGELQDLKIDNEKIYFLYKSGTVVSQENIFNYK